MSFYIFKQVKNDFIVRTLHLRHKLKTIFWFWTSNIYFLDIKKPCKLLNIFYGSTFVMIHIKSLCLIGLLKSVLHNVIFNFPNNSIHTSGTLHKYITILWPICSVTKLICYDNAETFVTKIIKSPKFGVYFFFLIRCH